MRAVTMSCIAAILCGCATPPEITRQAEHTAAMIGELKQSLADFDRQQRLASHATLKAIAKHDEELESVRADTAISDAIRQAAGDGQGIEARAMLVAAADLMAHRGDARKDVLARDAARRAAMKPLADGEALSATQRAAILMSEELSIEERLKAQRDFAVEVRDGVRKKRDEMRRQEAVVEAEAEAGR